MTHLDKSPVFLIKQVLHKAAELGTNPTPSASELLRSHPGIVSSSSIRVYPTSPFKVQVYTTAFLVHQGRGWNNSSRMTAIVGSNPSVVARIDLLLTLAWDER